MHGIRLFNEKAKNKLKVKYYVHTKPFTIVRNWLRKMSQSKRRRVVINIITTN